MNRFVLSMVAVAVSLCVVLSLPGSADASAARKLPTFELRDLEDRELRLTDARFTGKTLLLAAFSTWNEVSREQAREVALFHKAHPEVEVLAFVVNVPAEARDFVAQEGLTFPCYKCDPVSRASENFKRLFTAKKDKVLTLNRVPFAILVDADRTVRFANLGLTGSSVLSAEYAKFK